MKDTERIDRVGEDEEFVSRCRKGDADAFEVLVYRHQRRMFNIAYRMLGDYEEAANTVQDAFLAAYRSLRAFQGKSRFSTWLYSILINHCKNRLRQLQAQRLHEAFSLDDPISSPEGQIQGDPPSGEPSSLEDLERKDLQETVQRCIGSLEAPFREVLVLRDIQGFSYQEISEMLHLPEGTIKSRLFRARESLKEGL
ncbi:MAG: sigma-70 family RNA polymerase sigma factor, partial [candidate division NC10 bacterium]|nr:sigma-70 family RNA polymerase sigma factor [candidate division NC10 bacterium]